MSLPPLGGWCEIAGAGSPIDRNFFDWLDEEIKRLCGRDAEAIRAETATIRASAVKAQIPDPLLTARMQRYVDQLRPLMGLSDWKIEIVDALTSEMLEEMEEDPDEYSAWISPAHGARYAALWLSIDFYIHTDSEQRQVIVHELLHCHHYPEEDLVMDELGRWMAPGQHMVIKRWWTQANEYAVDAVAHAWAPRLPEVQWPRALRPALRLLGRPDA